MLEASLHAYTCRIEPARRRLRQRPHVRAIVDADRDTRLLHAFLIQWSALSVQLKEPVERFLAAASRRCAELSEHELARGLLRIASDAIERYRCVADDTRVLVELWNRRQGPRIDLTYLLTQPGPPSLAKTFAFHEQLLTGCHPWAELAAIYEVEAMLASFAPQLARLAEAVVGSPPQPGLSSVAVPRVSGTRRAMADHLARHPDQLERMVVTGERALELYAEFLGDCQGAACHLAAWRERAV